MKKAEQIYGIVSELTAMEDEKKAIQGLQDALNFLHTGQRDEAMRKCHEINGIHSGKPQVCSLCAQVALQCGKLDVAVQWFKAAIQLDGVKPEYHFDLGKLYLQMHRIREAIVSFENVLIIDPTHASAYLQLGLCYLKNVEYQKAITHFKKSIQRDPNRAASYYWMGIVFSKQNQRRQAIVCLEKAVTLDPKFAEAYFQLGLLHLDDGRLAQSRDCFYKALSENNRDWRAWGNLCMVLRDLGELNEAKHSGTRATSLNPGSFQAWHNLGSVYKDMSRYHDSISCYEKALSLNPESDVTYTGLGIAYQRIGDTDSAVNSFKMAIKFNPSAGTAIINLLNICMMECDWDKSSYYEKMIHDLTVESLCMGQVPSETPFLNLSRCDDPKLNMAVARAWSHDIANKMAGVRDFLRFQYPRKRLSKIRIGYLSNNFGDHPTAHITRRLYQLHDRSRFEVFCFSYGPEDNSRYRKAIQDGCDDFVDIREMSHAQAAKAINDHGVDILVDLVGFMKGHRMAIAALRPAPVQVRWLGMAGTSGADFFDYLITDRTVTPINQAGVYTEKFVYLPNCYQVNDNRPLVADTNVGRSGFELPEDAFVFCCFNTSYKIDATLFSSWMNILKRVSGSVLWLMTSSIQMQDNLKKNTEMIGVDPARLIFAEKIPKRQHLIRLPLADLVLDTIKVTGAASISDALWAGVPALTIQGKHFASRMSSSILKAVGLKNLVTTNLESYERMAVNLAIEKRMLQKIRKKLKLNISITNLFNTQQTVSFIEKAYERMWMSYVYGEMPTCMQVDKSDPTYFKSI